jgi:LacI family transcriptional regulator
LFSKGFKYIIYNNPKRFGCFKGELKMSVTIKDIAKKTGFSVTTVSRALNDFDDVSKNTKELIKKTAIEINYTPNAAAQRFQKKRTDSIGLILPTVAPRFSDPFFSEFIAGIGNRAANLGFDLLVSTRAPGIEEILAYKQMIQSRRVDGLIIVRTRRSDERIKLLKASKFPFVAFGRTEDEVDFPFVDEDSVYGMNLVAEYLHKMNHTRIACITAPSNLMFTKYRVEGLSKKLESLGIKLRSDLIREGDLTERSGYEKTAELLELHNRPTAIVACNDLMAFGAISAAQDRNLIIGKDLSITGFDDIPMAAYSHPTLTTVHQPIYQIGAKVCELLIDKINNKPIQEKQILLRPELIIRASTGPVNPTK